jgi:hypothetical protein
MLSSCWRRFKQAAGFLAKHTPLIKSLLSFDINTHRQAAIKFGSLWILSSLPVLFAILLSHVPEGDATLLAKFAHRFREAVTVSEAFVYAAAFISPVLFIIIQRYATSTRDEEKSLGQRFKTNLAGMFRGYVFVWIGALVVLFITAIAFAAQKTDPSTFKQTFLSEIGEILAPWLYLFSLICWYLTLCDEFFSGVDYSDASRASEDHLARDFSNRIHKTEEKK